METTHQYPGCRINASSAFPLVSSSGMLEVTPRSQWRDRAGFAPDFLVEPSIQLSGDRYITAARPAPSASGARTQGPSAAIDVAAGCRPPRSTWHSRRLAACALQGAAGACLRRGAGPGHHQYPVPDLRCPG